MSVPRRQARERALELLYESETKGLSPDEVIAALPVEPDRYATTLVSGVAADLEAIDDLLSRHVREWRPQRLAVVDRALLRIASYELAHQPNVPTAVAISEAVELAKQFSTEDSGRFVNGVLSGIAREVRGDADAGDADAADSAP